jgi:putative phosphoesterase
MRIAILSDIHANSYAFQAVLGDVRYHETELKLNAGDSIGYYLDPAIVVKMLQEQNFFSVLGNHEVMLRDFLEDDTLAKDIEARYGIGLGLCKVLLNSNELNYLVSLPDFLKIETPEGNIYVYHGTPIGNKHYFYPDSTADSIKSVIPSDCKWLILGNTHWPMIRHIGGTTIINPGSVGQPRNHSKGAHWAILDTQFDAITFLVTPYPQSHLISKLDFRGADFLDSWEMLREI